MRKYVSAVAFVCLIISLLVPVSLMAAPEQKQLVFDQARLLSEGERSELTSLANELGAERETDIIILTINNADNKDVQILTEDFYDDQAPGYDKPHGNAVILTLDMRNREIYLAGFYKAETYLDDKRLNKIRDKITPNLSDGEYKRAFEMYIKTAHRYMGFEPGTNPDNILFNRWFQLAVSLGLASLVVWIMVHRSGGRVTVNAKTYEASNQSGVLEREDRYINTTVTKHKIERNNGGGGSGRGGGGISGGGHSHSGSRGRF